MWYLVLHRMRDEKIVSSTFNSPVYLAPLVEDALISNKGFLRTLNYCLKLSFKNLFGDKV